MTARQRVRRRTGAANDAPRVAVVMGSESDWPVMQDAVAACRQFGVACDARVLSAHRMADAMARFARTAERRGVRVVIAGAGGAAHLPGMVAAHTVLPVIGVPVPSRALAGMDSLLSIVQMPAGVPVATVAIGGGWNAGLLAVQLLGAADAALRDRLRRYRQDLRGKAAAGGRRVVAASRRHDMVPLPTGT